MSSDELLPPPSTKQELMEFVVSLLGEEGEGYLHTKGSKLQRSSEEIFLIDDFYEFINEKHPYFSKKDAKEILEQTKDNSKPLQAFNKYFFQILREGFPYRRRKDDETYPINFIDFKNFENNIFRIVDQISFKATHLDYELQNAMSNEIDLIVYINGLPLFVWEFNTPREDGKSKNELLLEALQSIEYNAKSIPELFRYNAFCVICSGLREVKYGISWGEYSDYKEWKRISEIEKPQKNILVATIRGLFCKWRIIEILDTFICFSDTDPSKKVVCRYPQYFGATKLLKSIEVRCKNDQNGDGKGGVYFGSTGCGKSYTMLFLSKLLLSSTELKRPTILLITDRIALNDQLSKLFRDHREYLQCEEVIKIDNEKYPLRRTIKGSTSGGIYLTNIQKFRVIDEVLSHRWNFVCISDEAHRTQDNLGGGQYRTVGEKLKMSRALAQLLHESLPNATYVGFTATPRDQTLDAFGGAVDIYSMPQSVRDGFTVQIIAEWRETKLQLDEEIARQIDNIYAEMAQGNMTPEKIQDDQERRVSRRKTLSSPKILEVIAEEIIQHYERRVNDKTTSGKAMIVVDSREAARTMYNIFQKLRPQWFEEKDSLFPERAMVNLVISHHNPTDSEEMRETVEGLVSHSKLAREFKKDKSSFKIAIVCGMWLTGFDVPSLDTMYLNKYMQGHELIQAISRVNRSYESNEYKKEVGLVVFYVPLKRELRDAMESLESLGGGTKIINIDEIVMELEEKLQALDIKLSQFFEWDINAFLVADEVGKSIYINNTICWLEKQDDEYRRDIFLGLKDIRKKYHKCMSYDSFQKNKSCIEQIMLYDIIYNIWRDPSSREARMKVKEIDELIKQAFSVQSIQRGSLDDAINLHVDYHAKKEETFLPWSDEQTEHLTKTEERWIQQINDLQRHGEQGKSMAERLKDLIERYNSAWDELEKREIQKEIQELEKEIETFSKEEQAKKREEWRSNLICNKVLIPIKDKYQFEFEEEKMSGLAMELKQKGDEYTNFIDWDKKTAVRSKLKKDWKSVLNKNDWPPECIKETCENLLFIFKNFPQEERRINEEMK